jgi:hypothetical protein
VYAKNEKENISAKELKSLKNEKQGNQSWNLSTFLI